ncbi:MAG: alpha/beta fold hydrolase [Candidatus Heimdallarchaeaceae archaeon]|jgi:pimeloyl-ACP methyl ester carboxylesterase
MAFEEERLFQNVTLNDGRILSYADLGEKEGEPIFYFHGFPGSRLEGRLIHDKAKEVGLRVLSVDRPGFGLSDFQSRRKITDWSQDVLELADRLDFKKFGVFGISAGAPYALACALNHPEKLTVVGIISALGSVEFKDSIRGDHLFAFRLARFSKLLFSLGFWFTRLRFIRHENKAEIFSKRKSKEVTRKDQEILMSPLTSSLMYESQCESCRKGMKGLAYEAILLGKTWNLKLEEISKKLKIYLWHGEKDYISPVSATREIEKRLSNSVVKYYPEEGHYSLPINKTEEILKDIIQHF